MPSSRTTRSASAPSGYVEEQRSTLLRTAERFDRVAFAMRALRILRPRRMTVAVYAGSRELKVERGVDWGRGPESEWAVVSIPDGATRESIAVVLAELAGAARDPFVIDLLITASEPD